MSDQHAPKYVALYVPLISYDVDSPFISVNPTVTVDAVYLIVRLMHVS